MKWDLFVVNQTNRVLVMTLAEKLMAAGVISQQDYLDIYGDTADFLLAIMEDEDDPQLAAEYGKMAKQLLGIKVGIERKWQEL